MTVMINRRKSNQFSYPKICCVRVEGWRASGEAREGIDRDWKRVRIVRNS